VLILYTERLFGNLSVLLDRLRATLKEKQYSLTQPRQAVFLALQEQQPLSIHELVQRCATVDRASVYRSVALFEQLGILQRLQMGWKYKLELSDAFTAHHHHLVCLRCGKILDIEDEKHIDIFIRDAARRFGFTVLKHRFEVEGYCATCSASTRAV